MKIKLTLFILLVSAATKSQVIDIPVFATGFSNVVEITNAGDERLFVVEQAGNIKIVNPDGTVKPENFLTLTNSTVLFDGERGLLGLVFHPQYATNGLFYVYYSRASDGASILAKYTVDPQNPDQALSGSETILLELPQPTVLHKGGTLRFGPDGYLYLATGDGGAAEVSQSPLHLYGKILRIDVNNTNFGLPYAIPEGNPFLISGLGLYEIWAWGLRNPWKYSFDSVTGDLWLADVGLNTYEEINHVPSTSAGLNYGWVCYEANSINTPGCAVTGTTYTYPVAFYEHTNGACSITGGYVYRGAMYPALQGKYLFTDFCKGHIGMLDENNNISYSAVFENNYFTTFGQDMHGELYIAASSTGIIHKIVDRSLGKIGFQRPSLSVIPNPTDKAFSVRTLTSNYPAQLDICDLTGKLIFRQEVNGETENISTDHLQNGLYLISLTDKTGAVATAKLAVSHNL